MNAAVNTLTTTVTADSLWTTFGTCVPFIAVVVVVGFGMYLVRRMIKRS